MFVFQDDKNLKCNGYCLWLQTKLVAALVTWKCYKQYCLIFVQSNVTFLQSCLDDCLCNTTTTVQLINSPFLMAGDYFIQVSEPVFSDQQLLISMCNDQLQRPLLFCRRYTFGKIPGSTKWDAKTQWPGPLLWGIRIEEFYHWVEGPPTVGVRGFLWEVGIENLPSENVSISQVAGDVFRIDALSNPRFKIRSPLWKPKLAYRQIICPLFYLNRDCHVSGDFIMSPYGLRV